MENTNTRRPSNYSKISDDLKRRIFLYIDRNPDIPISEAARNFDVNPRTLRNIYSKYKTTGSFVAQPKGGAKNVKIEEIHRTRIHQLLEDNPTMSLRQLKEAILSEYSLSVTEKTIELAIKKMNITFKLSRLVPESRNTEQAIEARYEYAQMFFDRYKIVYRTELILRLPVGTDQIIYVDESGFNLHLRRSFGRAPRGERVRTIVPNSRGRNISIAAAMSGNGLIHFRSMLGAYNTANFAVFMIETIERCGPGSHYFVMDNVRFHHSLEIKNVIESRGHNLIFIPPYSPQLNPIELLFSKWKNVIKSSPFANNSQELISAIQNASQQITPSDCQGWIREATRFISRSLQRLEFIN